MYKEYPESNLFVADHPLISHKIAILRKQNTGQKLFQELISEITAFLGLLATRHFPVEEVKILTPVGLGDGQIFSGRPPLLVPVLRAGLGMVSAMQDLMPMAIVGHIGMARDETTLKASVYYQKLPAILFDRVVFLLDPMLATGGSAADAVDILKVAGAKEVKVISIIAAEPGLEVLHTRHPDAEVYCAVVDPILNSHGYIVPGLGDAGDRLNGW